MRKNIKRTIALFMTLLLTFTCVSILASAGSVYTPTGDFYKISETEHKIAPGVAENRVIINKASGTQQEMVYAVSVDTSASTTGFLAGYADYNGSKWKMQSVRDQAAKAAEARDANIVAAVNADIFNMSTGEPAGVLVMNGTIYKRGIGRAYFGITKSGEVVIGDSLNEATLATLQEAISGFYMIVKNGQRVGPGLNADSNVAPKTAVGVKADGSVVIVTVDGRNYPISSSIGDYDLATIMLDLGCVDVLNLDGGGSTTYLAKYEGERALNLKNNPSDAVERKVSSCLFVTSSATPSGVFDHASLSPNNEVYTPGSEVPFSAIGVDSAGEPSDLPSDGAFALANDSFGSITADGLFTSNGTTGTAVINYISGGEVKGSTSIEVREPDEIYFSDEEVSLGYDETKTCKELSLVVRYQDRDMIIKPGDIVWSTAFDTPMQGDKFEFNGRNVIYDSGDFHYYHSEQQGAAGSTSGKLMVVVDEALTDVEKAEFYPTILGTFSGNDFTSAPGNTVNGTITATSAYNSDLSANIHAVIGRLPVVIGDFEGDLSIGRWAFNANGGMLKWESEAGDYDLVTGHYVNGDGSSRGGIESAETVDVDSGEPVRFGNQSLKINYDFRNINGIEGACVGFAQQSQEIPGNPTGIGLWYYNPEGGRNFWLRIRLLDGMNNILTLDFTKQREGVNWFGWKYVECDLTKHQGPFKLLGGETIRVMHTYGAYDGMGNYLAGTVTPDGPDSNSTFLGQATCQGAVYVDNLQFVYGANIDDVDNPIIDSMSINNEDLVDGKTVVNTSDISLNAYVSDVQNKYTTGIDYDVLRIYVDGVNHTYDKYEDGTDACIITEGDGRIDLYNLKLADGDHSMTILVRDKFGNEATETRYFTVDTSGTSDLTNVELAPVGDPILGTDFKLEIKANDVSNIKGLSTKVKVDEVFGSNCAVVFGNGFDGDFSYNAVSKEITVNADETGEAKGDVIATISFPIAPDLAKGTQFTYSAPYGEFTMADDSVGSFACAPKYLDVVASYNIAATAAVVGHSVIITVTDRDGEPAADVNIKCGSDVLGTTGENGEFTTEALTGSVGTSDIVAEKDGAVSFVTQIQSVAATGKADGTPFSLMLNASADSETEKNITWLSNPAVASGNAIVQYATKADYDENGEAAFQNTSGTAKLVDFLGSADVNNNFGCYLNTVVVSGLAKGTEYVYRAGDGTIFSPVYSFKTLRDGSDVNFFIIGDTQTADGEIENIRAIQNYLATDGTDYDFGAQLGDFVEKGNMYADWEDILGAYDIDALKTMDQIHVNGNHEAFGYVQGTDVDDIFSTALYNMPNGKCFSAEYGNTYVAVIGYTNNETVLQNCIDWLREDAAKTNCKWKILLTHQPSYGTNAASMDTEHFTRLLPPALEELGFDFMFSGHDHAYARTEPLTGGEVDPENGVVYFVCGSTGEKSYTATDMPSHHNAVCSQEYDNGIYLTVEATDTEFTITTREGNGDILDTYTKTYDGCADGHTYAYEDDGYLTCSVCGHTESLGTYTGFATDETTGKQRYFTNGDVKTGWLNYEDECYYFDENGLTVSAGKLTLQEGEDTVTYTFDDEGKQVGGAFTKTKDGYTRCYRGGSYMTSWNVIDGKTYFFSTNASHPGMMLTGKTTIKIYTGQRITYNFDEKDGHLLDYVWVTDEAGTRYYWANQPVTGWKEIDGKTYYFDEATALMVTGTIVIDGKTYSFLSNGQLAHEGEHTYGDPVHKAACVDPETETYTCTQCGYEKVIELSPGIDHHIDENENKLCDNCGKFTGNVPSWIEPIFRALYRILYILRTMFKVGN